MLEQLFDSVIQQLYANEGTIDECKPVQHVCPIMRAKENLKQLFHGVKTRYFGAVI